MDSFNDTEQRFFAVPFVLYSTPSPLEGCSLIDYNSQFTAVEKGIMSAVSILSMISSIMIATTIFYNPKLRIHPSKIIGYICMCEALSCYNALVWAINPQAFICYFGLHYLYSWTTFGA